MFESRRERLPRAVKFSANRIARLFGKLRDLLVAQILVRDEQQQEPVFTGNCVEAPLNLRAQILRLGDAERRFVGRVRAFFQNAIVSGRDVSLVPGLPQVLAVVDRDPIQPCANLRAVPEGGDVAEGLQKYVLRRVLSARGIAEQTKREVVDGARVGLVNRGKILEAVYAMQNHLPLARIRNHAGAWVTPQTGALRSAANAMLGSADDTVEFAMSISDPPGEQSYPIASLSWLVVPSRGRSTARRDAMRHFVLWALEHGESDALALGYAPLPDSMRTTLLRAWRTPER